MPGRIIHNGARWWESLEPGIENDPPALLETLKDYFGDAEREQAAEPPRAVFFWRDILYGVPERRGEAAAQLVRDLRDQAARQAANEAEARGERHEGSAPRRVFLSHRQCDVVPAEHLANAIVADGRFDVWLDVWDPALKAVTARTMPTHVRAVLTALIIEMGLVNAAGIVALMTPNAAGSAWIPYEFGRVKTGGPFAQMAAGCRRGVAQTALPEYMLLGDDIECDPVSSSYTGLTSWLGKL